MWRMARLACVTRRGEGVWRSVGTCDSIWDRIMNGRTNERTPPCFGFVHGISSSVTLPLDHKRRNSNVKNGRGRRTGGSSVSKSLSRKIAVLYLYHCIKCPLRDIFTRRCTTMDIKLSLGNPLEITEFCPSDGVTDVSLFGL